MLKISLRPQIYHRIKTNTSNVNEHKNFYNKCLRITVLLLNHNLKHLCKLLEFLKADFYSKTYRALVLRIKGK